MRRLAVLCVVALALLGSCVSTEPLERELAAATQARRLTLVLDRVLAYRDQALAEALERGRIDRTERAAAARRSADDLEAALRAFDADALDTDAQVDRDLGLFLLARARAEMDLADAREPLLRALAGPATAVAFLADPTPPGRATIDLFAGGADGIFPKVDGPLPVDSRATSDDLHAASRRAGQASALIRARGQQASVLDPSRAAAILGTTEEAAGRANHLRERLERRADEVKKDAARAQEPAGREAFVVRLRTQHGVDLAPEELEAFGRELLAETGRELEALAAAEFPGRTWRQALDEVRCDHAAPSEMPAEALAAAEAARDFVIANDLMTIPPAARIARIEMVGDEMARSYPFAAYSFRRATEEGEVGRYMVSPGATWMTPEQREERLRGNCRAWTRVVAAHETWPGHHLQFWVADHDVPRVRRAASTPVFVEGWGLYCEGLLSRHGFFDAPADRLAVLVMRAWRAARVVLDVRLHCAGMSRREASDFLVEHAAFTRDAADAEVRRYLSSPTQPFAYAWGAGEIERLRADAVARLGPAFSEREFHDRLLRCGPIPFRFVRRLFGYRTADWRLEAGDWRNGGARSAGSYEPPLNQHTGDGGISLVSSLSVSPVPSVFKPLALERLNTEVSRRRERVNPAEDGVSCLSSSLQSPASSPSFSVVEPFVAGK